ncbi:MAG: SPOR domain-containing protein [Desulfatibacillum sp.]|nr:SPOR domain-containing protein [Desulfatibacillum sp.]
MAKTKTRDRDIRFSRKELFVFVSFVFVAMGIMFVLGIYVGRGMSPVRFDIQNLQNELAGLKASMVRAEEAQTEALEKELARQSEYDFFKQVRNPTGDLNFPAEEDITDQSNVRSGPPVHLKATKPATVNERALPVQEVPRAARAPAPAPVQAAAPAADNYDFWTIQVSAVVKQQDAAKMVDKFIKMGYPAYMLEAHPEPGRTIYRVRMGHFKTRDEAKVLGQRLSRDWSDYLILKK